VAFLGVPEKKLNFLSRRGGTQEGKRAGGNSCRKGLLGKGERIFSRGRLRYRERRKRIVWGGGRKNV